MDAQPGEAWGCVRRPRASQTPGRAAGGSGRICAPATPAPAATPSTPAQAWRPAPHPAPPLLPADDCAAGPGDQPPRLNLLLGLEERHPCLLPRAHRWVEACARPGQAQGCCLGGVHRRTGGQGAVGRRRAAHGTAQRSTLPPCWRRPAPPPRDALLHLLPRCRLTRCRPPPPRPTPTPTPHQTAPWATCSSSTPTRTPGWCWTLCRWGLCLGRVRVGGWGGASRAGRGAREERIDSLGIGRATMPATHACGVLALHAAPRPTRLRALVCACCPPQDIRLMNDQAMKAAPRKTGAIILGGGEQALPATRPMRCSARLARAPRPLLAPRVTAC